MTAKKSGNNLYTIKYLKSIRKDISAFPETVKLRIKNAIRGRTAIDPIGNGEPLQGKFKGQRKLRICDYRIIYRVNIAFLIIVRTGHRKAESTARRKDSNRGMFFLALFFIANQ